MNSQIKANMEIKVYLYCLIYKVEVIITNNVCTWMQNKITQQHSDCTECIPAMHFEA